MNKFINALYDIFIILAAISLILGLVSRVLVKPFALGLEAQSFLQFSVALLLFAIAGGIRQLMRK
jgi:hypothetical protein